MEWTAVPKAGYAIHEVKAQGIQRKLTVRNLTVPYSAMKGFWQSWNLVGDFDADVAVGTGGFVTGPVIWAAHQRGRPVLIQEQNAHVGVTNRILSRFADRIHTAFRETLNVFPPERTVVSGNPVRSELSGVSREEAKDALKIDQSARVLLVLGGSGGSLAVNDLFERQLKDFLHNQEVVLIWQTGNKYYDRLVNAVPPHPRMHLLKYVDRMDLAYAACDMAICRAGASTCSELLATGTPSILIPSPNVAEDHQTRNAESMVAMGAAVLVPESTMRSRLYDEWQRIWADKDVLEAMAAAAREHATPDAADQIAADVLELAERRQQ
jgi:UDP-N-acetylglucosamine--N-acetylmuramyl-(pentapeptide) pyrophosphoryl-undecaprenol N-acetylglucosamine transferase